MATLPEIHDILLRDYARRIAERHPNPLNRFGRKVFSQTDEDGITFEILRRIGRLDDAGTFAEFGVGNGLENNTLALAALGWRGFWVDGQDLAFDLPAGARIEFFRQWVTLENIEQLIGRGLEFVGARELDVVSVDLDGNDYYFVEAILANCTRPKLVIVEYNAKFPPPIDFKIDYDPAHVWRDDDYFGASLSSFANLLSQHDYRLVCCNSHTGSNAFFVRDDFSAQFADVPVDISEIYAEPNYYLPRHYAHQASARVAEKVLRQDSDDSQPAGEPPGDIGVTR